VEGSAALAEALGKNNSLLVCSLLAFSFFPPLSCSSFQFFFFFFSLALLC
jgi:hypothetical protein